MKTREGIVRGLGVDGDGAVPIEDGSIVLARGVLPGERVRLDEIGRGRVRRAHRVEILTPSPERVAPPCEHAAACGGCPLMHASERIANESKRDRVRRAMAGVAPGLAESIGLDAPATRLGYRRRARLAFERHARGITVGYRAESSRLVVDVARCLVLDPVLDGVLSVIRSELAPHLVGAGELRLGVASVGPTLRGTLRIDSRDPQPPALYAALTACITHERLAGAALWVGGASAPARFGIETETATDVDGRSLCAPLGGFGQAHAEHNHALVTHAIEAAQVAGLRVLELYAGHGNLTLALAARAASVTAVELDGPATECLRANLARHGIAARVITGDAARGTAALPKKSVDVVVLDPPREGARDAMAPLVALGPARIVYVACSPEALARDAAMLVAGGYRTTSVRAIDMFPQTAHVEVVARFER